jgi:MurNAc alpha-1-phosphate uridylyltransferase
MAVDKVPLRPLLDREIAVGRLSGEYHDGQWADVGTPQRLQQLDAAVRSS